MKIVLKYKSIVKLFTFSHSWEELVSFIEKEFKLTFPEFTLTYQDDEEDSIMICGNEDLQTALDLNSKSILKIIITLDSSQKKTQNVTLIEKEPIQKPIQVVNKQQEKLQNKKEQENIQEKKMEVQKKEPQQVWNHWGRNKSHHHGHHHKHSHGQIFSSQSSKHHSSHKKMFHRMRQCWNESISQQIDERVKILIPCIRAQLQGNPIKILSVENPIVHNGTECKSCFATPIVGIRYKCLVCPNFNLCQNCEGLVEHQHNLLKMKKPEAMQNEDKKYPPFGNFWGSFRHHLQGQGKYFNFGHSHSSDRSQSMNNFFGCHSPRKFWLTKKCNKLAFIFGGQPQSYKEFVEKNLELRPRQAIKKYAFENKIEQKQVTKKIISLKCNKLAACFDKKPEDFTEFVEKNMDMRPWQMKRILIQSGAYPQVKRIHHKSAKEQWQEKEQKPKAISKKDKKVSPKKQSTEIVTKQSSQYQEKGKIYKTMVELFGTGKPYYPFIQKHLALGQQIIIGLWLEQTQSRIR